MDIDYLISLPPVSAQAFSRVEPERAVNWFAASDPPGRQLGSGGGTAYLLRQAWQASGEADFFTWLETSRKTIVHGSGQSRRLPAYAAAGKPLTPIPVNRHDAGQPPDQIQLDLLKAFNDRVIWHAPEACRVMVTCGDALLELDGPLPCYPEADVLILGLEAREEELQHHGAMFCENRQATQLSFFLQKPSVTRLRELHRDFRSYLDTGIWLLSERAVRVLFSKCGWDEASGDFPDGIPTPYELFAEFGLALGQTPALDDPVIRTLSCHVLPLPEGRFYHFGTNQSLIRSAGELMNPAFHKRSFGHGSPDRPPSTFLLNSRVGHPLTETVHNLWIENCRLPNPWTLASNHVLTNIPDNNWTLRLAAGACLDMAPLKDGRWCLRPYGFEDSFRGPVGDGDTLWLGSPVKAWMEKRGLTLAALGIDPATDLQQAPVFPALALADIDSGFVEWLMSHEPVPSDTHRDRYQNAGRKSAADLLLDTDLERLYRMRHENLSHQLSGYSPEGWLSDCPRFDLKNAAACYRRYELLLPAPAAELPGASGMRSVHDRMFRYAAGRLDHAPDADHCAEAAFALLRELIVGRLEMGKVLPVRNVLEDQIVWGRSPVRLDLAGGWTDTPPYCIEHGGQVVNVAVNLNGQPPIQTFCRVSGNQGILIRSIDLGIDEVITEYAALRKYSELGSAFGIVKAALCLAGFIPEFNANGGYPSLADQLVREFGGGLEISMLAAVPKGSGLGTSSILASTILGSLSELCGLNWSDNDLFQRTLALEQMLTSGGGWQDQVGGITRGLKLIETAPGLTQHPVIRWLPETFFGPDYTNHRVMLYYTGLTRVARGILGEIVRGMVLNENQRLNILGEIGFNAAFISDAIQCGNWEGTCEAVRRSWRLNQLLDAGTNPPEVQQVLHPVQDYLAGCKLLGAGGGGYMLLLAKDDEASRSIRRELTDRPPNARARFVDLSLSDTGLEITRS